MVYIQYIKKEQPLMKYCDFQYICYMMEVNNNIHSNILAPANCGSF